MFKILLVDNLNKNKSFCSDFNKFFYCTSIIDIKL